MILTLTIDNFHLKHLAQKLCAKSDVRI